MASPFTLEPADEYPHANSGESDFNESMYFNFFDAAARLGGFLRIGNRVNEGHAETTACLYAPDGDVLFNFARAAIDTNDRFAAGGARFEVEQPLERLRIGYRGKACRLADPLQMSDPRKAFAENPFEEVDVELEIRALAPAVGGERRGGPPRSLEAEFARGHYEQHHRAVGHVEIGGRRHAFDGFGLRDHSWGPRSWQAPLAYRWLTANFGADFGFAVTHISGRDGSEIRGGYIHRGREIVPVRGVEIATEFRGEQQVHDRLQVRLAPAGEPELVVLGRVLSLIPLRNRRDGRLTRISEGMTEWSCEGRVGHGLSEYLDQLA